MTEVTLEPLLQIILKCVQRSGTHCSASVLDRQRQQNLKIKQKKKRKLHTTPRTQTQMTLTNKNSNKTLKHSEAYLDALINDLNDRFKSDNIKVLSQMYNIIV